MLLSYWIVRFAYDLLLTYKSVVLYKSQNKLQNGYFSNEIIHNNGKTSNLFNP